MITKWESVITKDKRFRTKPSTLRMWIVQSNLIMRMKIVRIICLRIKSPRWSRSRKVINMPIKTLEMKINRKTEILTM